jgi:hypothetical protein
LASAKPADAGNYTVLVTNPFGAVTSQVATLTVIVRLQATLSGGTNLAVSFPTRNSHQYFTEYKNTLADPSWTRFSTNNGTGGTLTVFIPVTNAPSRFFRVIEQ